jgi:hypothetical protein
MPTKKRKVALKDCIILYGVGLKSVVKYAVSLVTSKCGTKHWYKLQVVGEHGRTSYFTTKKEEFFEGDTLYKHGYRIYMHSAAIEKKYISYLVRHNLHTKLKKISKIMERANGLSPNKMFALSLLCDNMIIEAAKIDRRIKTSYDAI